MADWATIAQVATAAGTLVLAVATFGSIRASARSTELAERALLAGLRPLLVPSREDDSPELVRFGDGQIVVVPGHGGLLAHGDDDRSERLYMAIALRNGGAGVAVIHGWAVTVGDTLDEKMPPTEAFRRQLRDMYIPAGDTGFWQGAIRDRENPDHALLTAAERDGERVMVDLLYGDHEGGQRMVTRFGLSTGADEQPRCEVLRVWVLEGVDPRRA